jgi:putative SOS response-associated peptidase YedK
VELTDEDARIFPDHYAPVMVWEDGRRVVKPMRYQCRPADKPAFFDSKFPGTYNARRDNLEGGFWKDVFGCSHGVMRPAQDMLVACLWSRWVSPDGQEALLSFAAITDEPPPEVAAAGHDRCIIPIKPHSTWMPGCSRRHRTWRRSTPSSMTGSGRTTSIGWQRRPAPSLHPRWRQTCPRPPPAAGWRC